MQGRGRPRCPVGAEPHAGAGARAHRGQGLPTSPPPRAATTSPGAGTSWGCVWFVAKHPWKLKLCLWHTKGLSRGGLVPGVAPWGWPRALSERLQPRAAALGQEPRPPAASPLLAHPRPALSVRAEAHPAQNLTHRKKRVIVVPATQRTELEKAAEEGGSRTSRPRAGRRRRWERDLLQEPCGCTRALQPPAAARPRRCSAASRRAGMEPGAGEVAPSTGTCPEGSRARNSPAAQRGHFVTSTWQR